MKMNNFFLQKKHLVNLPDREKPTEKLAHNKYCCNLCSQDFQIVRSSYSTTFYNLEYSNDASTDSLQNKNSLSAEDSKENSKFDLNMNSHQNNLCLLVVSCLDSDEILFVLLIYLKFTYLFCYLNFDIYKVGKLSSMFSIFCLLLYRRAIKTI